METVGNVVEKPCSGWEAAANGDQLRVKNERTPCAICDQPVRIQRAKFCNTDSGRNPWLGEWAPAAHISTITCGPISTRIGGFHEYDTAKSDPVAPCPIADQSAQALGYAVIPDCAHMLRSAGPGRHTAYIHDSDIPENFSVDKLRSLATEGVNWCDNARGCTPQFWKYASWDFGN